MEAGMQAGERLSEVAEERGLTKEGLKEAARDVGETFSSALATDDMSTAQALDRHSGGRVRTKPQQAQSGATNTQSSKSSRSPSSEATPPSGGRT
jgi:hypothetical protein